MAGRVLRVVEMREFNFQDVTAGATALITAVQHIDVSWAREITLAVRWHDGDIQTGTSVAVFIVPDGHTQDDPTASFVDATAPSGAVTFDNTSGNLSAPLYRTYKVGSSQSDAAPGAMVSVFVSGTQAATVTGLKPRLSVDLLLQD